MTDRLKPVVGVTWEGEGYRVLFRVVTPISSTEYILEEETGEDTLGVRRWDLAVSIPPARAARIIAKLSIDLGIAKHKQDALYDVLLDNVGPVYRNRAEVEDLVQEAGAKRAAEKR